MPLRDPSRDELDVLHGQGGEPHRHAAQPGDRLARDLRVRPVPVVLRTAEDALLVDPRTLLPGDDEEVVIAVVESVTSGA